MGVFGSKQAFHLIFLPYICPGLERTVIRISKVSSSQMIHTFSRLLCFTVIFGRPSYIGVPPNYRLLSIAMRYLAGILPPITILVRYPIAASLVLSSVGQPLIYLGSPTSLIVNRRQRSSIMARGHGASESRCSTTAEQPTAVQCSSASLRLPYL